VRPELLAALPAFLRTLRGPRQKILKAYNPQEKRDHGRWAKTTTATRTEPLTTVEDLVGAEQATSPFSEASAITAAPAITHASPFLSDSPIAVIQPTRSPFTSTSPFLSDGPDPFDRAKARAKNLAVTHHHFVAPPAPDKVAMRAPGDDTFYLPVDNFHENTAERPIGSHYELSDQTVNFSRSHSRPVASSFLNPWQMLSDDHIYLDKANTTWHTQAGIERMWEDLQPIVMDGFNTALREVDDPDEPIAAKLRPPDLHAIFRLAGEDEPAGVGDRPGLRRLAGSRLRRLRGLVEA
jgi:hypothetical protein